MSTFFIDNNDVVQSNNDYHELLLKLLSSSGPALYDCACLYGFEFLLVSTLVAITIYRREMSCNHCYADDDDDDDDDDNNHHDNSNKDNIGHEIASLVNKSLTNASGRSNSDSNDSNTERQQQIFVESFFNDLDEHFLTEGPTVLVTLWTYVLRVLPLYSASLYVVPELIAEWSRSKDTLSTEEFLEGASHFFSGQPIFQGTTSTPTSSSNATSTARKKRILLRESTSVSVDEKYDEQEVENFDDENDYANSKNKATTTCRKSMEAPTVFTTVLPSDLTIHILTYLHPKDIVSCFGCTSMACYKFINNASQEDQEVEVDAGIVRNKPNNHEISSSQRLWKKMFDRDYAWIVECWDVGCKAKQRSWMTASKTLSACTRIQYTKEFYFRFGLCYMNYILAGQNTVDRCLVGISGHIYDITPFLMKHPGSTETVLVHAGLDATSNFERMRHTNGARKMAQTLCIIVDLSRTCGQKKPNYSTNTGLNTSLLDRSYGLRPTFHLSSSVAITNIDQNKRHVCFQENSFSLPPDAESQFPYPKSSRSPNRLDTGYCPTMEAIRCEFLQEEKEAISRSLVQYGSEALGGNVNVYYDPYCCQWKAWYIDAIDFENKFREII